MPRTQWPPADAAFAVLTLGSLVVSQFGVHARINHSYAAVFLLSLWAARDGHLARLWMAMIVILGVAHFSAFGLGEARLRLPDSALLRYPEAAPLLRQVQELPASRFADRLLAFQSMVNRAYVLGPTAVSMLSAPVCVVACVIIRRVFTLFDRLTRE